MSVKYDMTITDIGGLAKSFLSKNHSATLMDTGKNQELNDMVISHRGGNLTDDIAVGDKLTFCGTSYQVTKVGAVANDNLRKVGHCTILFNEEGDLPGQISVSGDKLPSLNIDGKITFSD